MTEVHETCKCTDCGAAIDIVADNLQSRTQCNVCGSTRRTYTVDITEKITAIDGYALKAKRIGQKKSYIEDRSLPDYSRSREKHVRLERIIDRDNDRYFEKVTDYQTGEIIHHCEEPLSQHQGHGSAKYKKSAR